MVGLRVSLDWVLTMEQRNKELTSGINGKAYDQLTRCCGVHCKSGEAGTSSFYLLGTVEGATKLEAYITTETSSLLD